ncbi:hypothetical protein VTI74DRAFT_10780 [Chaetomium olivicolor]
MISGLALLACVLGAQEGLAVPPSPYLNWRTFTAKRVNLGGWLHQEAIIDPGFWAQYGGNALGEWELCVNLGSRCGPVLEQRYATYIRPADVDNRDPTTFGTPASLSDAGAAWVLAYFKGVVERVKRANPNIPAMLQGGFKVEEYWAPHFDKSTPLVFGVHNYYFAGRPTTSDNIPQFIYADAKNSAGDGKFPVFVGEWSVQSTRNNTFSSRAVNLNTGLRVWETFTRGSA